MALRIDDGSDTIKVKETNMSFEGTFANGAVTFTEPPPISDGTIVEVVVKPKARTTLGDRLMALAGLIEEGLPEDFAAEHDHYVHGTPRRTTGSDS
ncbi:MAG: hypothetical protein U0791_11290 [Gemmataceae bacterium]